MKKTLSISIGIPAYNESANIKQLLISLLSQVEKEFKTVEIIVASDGSTDGTDGQVRSLKSESISLISDKTRMGKSARINQIFRLFKGDVLLLIDADVVINDKLLISKVVSSADFKKSGLIAINAKPLKARSIFQKIIYSGFLVSSEIGKRWENGDNYLMFKGCFLGLSKSLVKSIDMPKEIVNNDSFLYFAAKDLGFSPVYIESACVYFKTPGNFSDHVGQSIRFKTSQAEMQKYFKKDLNEEYHIPLYVYIAACLKCLFSNPFYFLSYIIINTLSNFKKREEIKSAWNIALSTKN